MSSKIVPICCATAFLGGLLLLFGDRLQLPSPGPSPQPDEFYADDSGADTAVKFFRMYRNEVGNGLKPLAARIRNGEFPTTIDAIKQFSVETTKARETASMGPDKRLTLLSSQFKEKQAAINFQNEERRKSGLELLPPYEWQSELADFVSDYANGALNQ